MRRPLEARLDAHGLGSGPIEAEPVGEGHSNVTYLVRRGDAELVLRRPPRPPLPPSAHDVLREARLLTALETADVRTPRVLLACDDESVIGAPFYVMERDRGRRDRERPAARGSTARRSGGASARSSWTRWSRSTPSTGRRAGSRATASRPATSSASCAASAASGSTTRRASCRCSTTSRAWLAEHRPESGPATIVHGDYRLGNVMFAPGNPARLNSIFDWELATIGDPLADVGYLVATWGQAGDAETPFAALGGLTRGAGFPTREELVARYEAGSGRSMSDVRWYMTLALWKSAIFLEGSYQRRLAGTTDDPLFDLLEQGVPDVAERAWRIAQGSGA